MLLELTITDFAIIDALRLTLDGHLDVFTGETGAGKSILIDAIGALVGERVPADVVRAGSARAMVEGVFDIARLLAGGAPRLSAMAGGQARRDAAEAEAEPESESLAAVLAELGIEAEDGALIISREIVRTGRGIARLNGRAVPLSALQRVARLLVDIHGQGAHLTLLRPEQHVFYLDRYAGAEELRGEVAALVSQWRALRHDIARLQQDDRELERRAELLRYQVAEITTARLRPGEIEALERERRVLANAERLIEQCAAVHAALSGDELGEARGALDLLGEARRALSDLLRLDDQLREPLEALEQALFVAEDAAAAVRAYQDGVALDPARQAAVEERLDLIARLRRKYGATIEEILAFATEAQAELETLDHREERVAALRVEEQALRERVGAVAGTLAARRRAACASLAAAMERELVDLQMRRAHFQVEIVARRDDADGVPVDPALLGLAEGDDTGDARYAVSPTGVDRIEFLIAPNPGEPLKPLARITSGGETSRLMLALKTILASADAVPVLIFDEIDTGISGQAAQVVGEKLWHLGRSHQVLCVTHLPQIAALGDAHYHVRKRLTGERTTTEVARLDGQERVVELGQMLGGGARRAARENAAELLSGAETWKALGEMTGRTA